MGSSLKETGVKGRGPVGPELEKRCGFKREGLVFSVEEMSDVFKC